MDSEGVTLPVYLFFSRMIFLWGLPLIEGASKPFEDGGGGGEVFKLFPLFFLFEGRRRSEDHGTGFAPRFGPKFGITLQSFGGFIQFKN
jgi:hypothetical protein